MKIAYRSAFWLNLSAIVVTIVLIVTTQFLGLSAGELFRHPTFSPNLTDGLLTHTFQILCVVPVVTCAFSFSLLNLMQPKHPQNRFIYYSAWIAGGFLVNEIFRIHIHLIEVGIPKLVTIAFYAFAVSWYGYTFRRSIRNTPYFVLILGLVCLATGITIDAVGLNNATLYALAEGIPKLLSEINIGLYFWWVCWMEVTRSLQPG